MGRKIAPVLRAFLEAPAPDHEEWAAVKTRIQARDELRALLAVERAAAKAMRVLRDAGQWADWASDEDKALDRALERLERVSKPRSGGEGGDNA